jgi:putative transcriptional regulator
MIRKNYNRIKELLAKENKSNLQLAEYLGVHEQTVSGWCTNHSQPKCQTLFKISDFFEMEAGELLRPKKDLKPIKSSSGGSTKNNSKKSPK